MDGTESNGCVRKANKDARNASRHANSSPVINVGETGTIPRSRRPDRQSTASARAATDSQVTAFVSILSRFFPDRRYRRTYTQSMLEIVRDG